MSGENFSGAIVLGGGQLSGGNYPGDNCPGSNCPGGQFSGGNCPRNFSHIVMICIKKIYFLIILTFDLSIFSWKRRENIITNVFPYRYVCIRKKKDNY